MKNPAEVIPPPGWGDDTLTTYFDHAQRNRWATFVQEPKAFLLLRRIDMWLDALRDGLINPKHEISASLLLRAQLLFQTTCELAMSGSFYASMSVQRSCMEAAAYALRLVKEPGALQIWLGRDDTAVEKAAARRLFTHGKTKASIAKVDQGLADVYSALYDRTIDFGAHPNPLGIWSGADITAVGRNFEVSQIGLHVRGPALDAALKSSAQAGLVVIRVAGLIWPERVEILRLNDEMWALRRAC